VGTLVAVFILVVQDVFFAIQHAFFCQWLIVYSMGVTCHLCLFVDVASWSLPQLIAVLFFKLAM